MPVTADTSCRSSNDAPRRKGRGRRSLDVGHGPLSGPGRAPLPEPIPESCSPAHLAVPRAADSVAAPPRPPVGPEDPVTEVTGRMRSASACGAERGALRGVVGQRLRGVGQGAAQACEVFLGLDQMRGDGRARREVQPGPLVELLDESGQRDQVGEFGQGDGVAAGARAAPSCCAAPR